MKLSARPQAHPWFVISSQPPSCQALLLIRPAKRYVVLRQAMFISSIEDDTDNVAIFKVGVFALFVVFWSAGTSRYSGALFMIKKRFQRHMNVVAIMNSEQCISLF